MLLRVGLTGGLASGKSAVGRELRRLGCHLIEADQLGHQTLLRATGEAYQPVIDQFGPGILDESSKEIDRRKLAAIVFADAQKLAQLNAIVHPAVRRLGDRKIAEIPSGILIYEAAILVETGGSKNFDKLIVAACPEQMQISRAMERDHATREEVLARLSRQAPLSEKVRQADYVIDTSGTMEQTLERTAAVYQRLVEEWRTRTKKEAEPK